MRTKKITAFLAGAAMMANPLSALADCPNAVALNVGDKVTDCPRIGLSLDYDRQVRKDLVDRDYNKQIVDQQKKLLISKTYKSSRCLIKQNFGELKPLGSERS